MLQPERLKQEGEIFKIMAWKDDLTVLREDRSSVSGTYLLAYNYFQLRLEESDLHWHEFSLIVYT